METPSLFNNDVTTVVIYWMRIGRGAVAFVNLESPRGVLF